MAQELYELPQGWEWKTLQELGKFSGGGTPSKSNPDFWGGDQLWITPKDMKSEKLRDSQLKITDTAIDKSSAKLIPAGSILIVARSGILRHTLPVCINEIEATVNQDIKVFIPSKKITSAFCQKMLIGHEPMILRDLVKGGVTVESLKYQEFQNHPFPVPPLAEQERIVAKLDALFSRIDQAIAQLQHTQAQTKALFASALDAVFESNRKWPEKTIKEVFLVINGRAYKQPELLSEGKYKVIRIQNLKGGETYYYSDLELKEDKYCENGDLLFSWSGTPGTSFGAFIWGGEKGIFHYHIWNMKPIVELNLQFGYWLLRHLTNEAISNSRGVAGMLHITKGMMENFKVNLPPLAEQSKIVAQLDAISERTQALTAATNSQLEKLGALKASLLDAAFRGQLPSDQ